jgi:hypothetical protein
MGRVPIFGVYKHETIRGLPYALAIRTQQVRRVALRVSISAAVK